jgi:2,3-dihydroxyphenylpropionate 1,2-dioxygenase
MATDAASPQVPHDPDGGQRTLAVCVSHSPGMMRDSDRSQGLEFRRGLARVRAAVEAFAPDLVVLFGTDHWRGFPENVPAVAVLSAAAALGDLGSPAGPYKVPGELAVDTASSLLRRGVDCALVRNGHLDHGFGQTAADVLGGIDRFPVLPVFLNCALPPLMPPARAADIGREIGDILRPAGRVLFLASGGLSHDPPSLAASAYGMAEADRRNLNAAGRADAGRRVRPDLDERFLQTLSRTDRTWVSELEDWYLPSAGGGGNEIRTWLACWGAAGGGLDKIAYEVVPEWITGMGAAGSSWAF